MSSFLVTLDSKLTDKIGHDGSDDVDARAFVRVFVFEKNDERNFDVDEPQNVVLCLPDKKVGPIAQNQHLAAFTYPKTYKGHHIDLYLKSLQHTSKVQPHSVFQIMLKKLTS